MVFAFFIGAEFQMIGAGFRAGVYALFPVFQPVLLKR